MFEPGSLSFVFLIFAIASIAMAGVVWGMVTFFTRQKA